MSSKPTPDLLAAEIVKFPEKIKWLDDLTPEVKAIVLQKIETIKKAQK